MTPPASPAHEAALPPSPHPFDDAHLRAGLDQLAARDPDVARALAKLGYPSSRAQPPGFPTLLRILTAQQLSTHSAAAIWGRLGTALGENITAEAFLALDEAALREIGFSRQKVTYGRALAGAIVGGTLDLATLATQSDADALAAITAIKGFGRWSAEIYLLFALGRADVLPAGDLGLQLGMQKLKHLDARPSEKELVRIAEPWRPQRGCGAVLLWRVYGAATLD